MTYTPASDRSLRRAIVRLLEAEEAHIFLGEVPHFSDDHEEQERISYYRRKIVRERARAETCLPNPVGGNFP